jgi:hypothetical protein
MVENVQSADVNHLEHSTGLVVLKGFWLGRIPRALDGRECKSADVEHLEQHLQRMVTPGRINEDKQ